MNELAIKQEESQESNVVQFKPRTSSHIAPRTWDETMDFAKMLSNSAVIPNSFRGKPGDIVAAITMGSEVGLKPMQSLQNIAVINGKPCLWGDALLALVQSSPQFEYIKETDSGDTATCEIKRKGEPAHKVTFSMEDAKLAGLANKQGPWRQYPRRMRQMRARGFAIRDKFSDAIMGFNLAEEVRDYNVKPKGSPKDVTPAVEEPNNRASYLDELLWEKEVPKETIEKWLADEGVNELKELPPEKIESAIKRLEGK